MAGKIYFTKMQGAGNDYIYVDTSLYTVSDPVKAAIEWSDRHKGIGADGLVLIGRSEIPEADYTMRIFNADGSEARMCGNASRCIGKPECAATHRDVLESTCMRRPRTYKPYRPTPALPMREGAITTKSAYGCLRFRG